jgi:hypothetical protein
MTNIATLVDSVGPSTIEAQAYAEIWADEIPTLMPEATYQAALVESCKLDFSRKGEDLTGLWAVIG